MGLSARKLAKLQVHLVPVFLGGGVGLFDGLGPEIELESMRVIESDAVTHLKYRVVK
jgi:hypothetical protein